MPKLLIVDDESNVLYSLRMGLETDDLEIHTAMTARQGLSMLDQFPFDAVIVDVKLPDLSGLDLFTEIKQRHPKLPVIIFTAFATTDTAIEAMKRGAFEYLLKPVDLHQLRDVVSKALELSRIQNVPAKFDSQPTEPDLADSDQIVGKSPAMQEIYKLIGRFAPQDVTVLILGESGTGKELVARAIYQHSTRADKPFQAINCAAIPETLLESELFGHEKGAFTGADRQRIGKFEQSDGGTLFLDEIGDMSPVTQAKVLRVLQDQQFERVGGRESIRTDVRLLAATNRKIEELVAQGRFREDLYYRLNVVALTLPPLRERAEDIPALVQHFVQLMEKKLKKSISTVLPDVMECLRGYHWPGNVRELQNVVRYAVIRAASDIITLDCLPTTLLGQPSDSLARPQQLTGIRERTRDLLAAGHEDIYRKIIHEVDRVLLEEALQHVRGNQVHASELLGISRTTLRAKLAIIQQENQAQRHGSSSTASPAGNPTSAPGATSAVGYSSPATPEEPAR
jgi:two-component system nitrogen regulation response regulator GlnG